jgi:hypothetical protein
MTLINQDLASPFLSPRGAGVPAEEPPTPFDDSAEGMRRLRDPFAVNPSVQPEPATADDEPGGH